MAVFTALSNSKCKDQPHDEAKDVAKGDAEIHRAIRLRKEPQHVLLSFHHLRSKVFWQGQHCPAEQRSSETHFDGYRQDGLESGSTNLRMANHRAAIWLQRAREIGDGFHAAQGQDYTHKSHPRISEILVRRLEISQGKVRPRHEDDGGHHDHRGNRQRNGNTSTMARTEIVENSDQKNGGDRAHHHPVLRNAEVAQRSPAAQCRGDREIRDKQQSSHHRQQPPLCLRRRVDSAAFRESAADNHVVEPDESRQKANRQDDRKRRIAGGHEGQTNDIGLAGSPVAIEQRRGTLPIKISRSLNFQHSPMGRILDRQRSMATPRESILFLRATKHPGFPAYEPLP